MPRLARPVPRDRSGSRSPVVRAVSSSYHRFVAFAAVNLPTNFPENPLKEISLILDFPWLKPQDDDADGHPNKRRLLTVSEFFRYTDDQGTIPTHDACVGSNCAFVRNQWPSS